MTISINDIVYRDPLSKSMIDKLVSGKMPPQPDRALSIILHGFMGTGKSTLAKMLPEAIEKGLTNQSLAFPFEYYDSLYDGQNIIEKIGDKLNVSTFNCSGRDYFVVDEVDMFTYKQQMYLRAFLNSKFAVFIMTTNYIDKIDDTIKDRSYQIEMSAISQQQLSVLLYNHISKNNLSIDTDSFSRIITESKGSIRKLIDLAAMFSV
jgi:replication-associated recombination protein RarA